MATLSTEYHLLGPLEVFRGEAVVAAGGQKRRALLARLLIEAGRTVSVDALVDALWGEAPPPTAVKMVHIYVSQLRKELPLEALRTRPPGYVLEVAPEALDLLRFTRLCGEGRAALADGDAARAATLLRDALALWRGPALAEFSEPFAAQEAAHLEELRLLALEDRLDADLALGRHAAVVAELQALVAAHPLRERPRGRLMLALYRAGRHADALATYHDLRVTLHDELGIDPSAALRELQVRILNQDPELDLPAAAAPAPVGGERIVGRADELERLERALAAAWRRARHDRAGRRAGRHRQDARGRRARAAGARARRDRADGPLHRRRRRRAALPAADRGAAAAARHLRARGAAGARAPAARRGRAAGGTGAGRRRGPAAAVLLRADGARPPGRRRAARARAGGPAVGRRLDARPRGVPRARDRGRPDPAAGDVAAGGRPARRGSPPARRGPAPRSAPRRRSSSGRSAATSSGRCSPAAPGARCRPSSRTPSAPAPRATRSSPRSCSPPRCAGTRRCRCCCATCCWPTSAASPPRRAPWSGSPPRRGARSRASCSPPRWGSRRARSPARCARRSSTACSSPTARSAPTASVTR